MKKTLLAAGTVAALSTSFTAGVAENDKPQYLSNWWHQGVNVVDSYHTHFEPQIHSDTYLEYEAFAKEGWFDLYDYVDVPVFFGGNSVAKSIWNNGSPLFMGIGPHFSIDKLTNTDLSFGPFKEWHFANSYIHNMGHNDSQEQNAWYTSLGTDIDTGLPMSPSLSVYAKYQWRNYGASNGNEWDGYHFRAKYFVPLTDLWGGSLSHIGFTNFDWGSDLGDDNSYGLNGKHVCINNSIAFNRILVLNRAHWHYLVVVRYFHNGGRWANDTKLSFDDDDFSVHSTGRGGYFVVGYNF